ncbi:hypothetical protein [Amycolatopsis deserti]|nr:hypothetical protein [Amycolatopsis deserti]
MTLEELSMPVVEDRTEEETLEHVGCLERALGDLVRAGWRIDPAGG